MLYLFLYLFLYEKRREREQLLVRILADLSSRDVVILLRISQEMKRIEAESANRHDHAKQISSNKSQWIERFRKSQDVELGDTGRLSIRRIEANGLIVEEHHIHLSSFALELVEALADPK